MLTDRQKPKSRMWPLLKRSRWFKVGFIFNHNGVFRCFCWIFFFWIRSKQLQHRLHFEHTCLQLWFSVDIIEIYKNHYCSWSIFIFICVFLLLHLYRLIISFLESDFTSSAFTWFPFRLERLVLWISIYGWSHSVEIS